MRKTIAGLFIGLFLLSCNTSQNNDAVIDDLAILSDSTGMGDASLPGDSDYAPYGQAKAQELSASRKNALETILKAHGIQQDKATALALALRDSIGFNEWDVVEEGENIRTTSTDQGPVTLTALIFGPFDGNGRAYSVLAISGNRIYLSDEYWQYTTTDSVYNIQMATDKRIEVRKDTLFVTSPSRGKIRLRPIP